MSPHENQNYDYRHAVQWQQSAMIWFALCHVNAAQAAALFAAWA